MSKSSQAALVTAGAKRIGKAISLHLAEIGFDIALHYFHSQKEALNVKKEIEQKGRRCEIFSCNFHKEKEMLTLIDKVFKKFPHLSVLVNNASIFEESSLQNTNLDHFRRHMDINLKTPFFLSQAFARCCKIGHIINILDTNIVKNKTKHLAYLLTKKALAELTKLCAIDLAPNIRVNAIAPGLILPPEGKDAQYLQKRSQAIPLQKKGETAFVIQALEFLLKSSFITGQIIHVDGGENLI